MADKLLPGLVVTAGAGVFALWYLYREQRERDTEAIHSVAKKAEKLAQEVARLKKEIDHIKKMDSKTEDEQAQLKQFSENLSKLSSDNSRKIVRIGTRDSKLAMWQALHVEKLLNQLYPHLETKIIGMKTLGDKDLKSSLSSFSNKGVFTKELDAALICNEVDIAVHSMKDLPTVLENDLKICSVLTRGNTQDAFVLSAKHKRKYTRLEDLPENSTIGTSALRRRAMLAHHFQNFNIIDVRGNLQTRFRKLDAPSGPYDGLILARTGLERLELSHRITQVLDEKKLGYAVSQGALAVVCRGGDAWVMDLCEKMNDVSTYLEVTAERALLRTLEGGCKVPIAVETKYDLASGELRLKGWVTSLDGKKIAIADKISSDVKPNIDKSVRLASELGENVADMLKQRGAEEILIECRGEIGEHMGHVAPKKQN